jgi:hypothetical protein
MGKFRSFMLVLLVMLIGLAFLPLGAETFLDEVSWQRFATIYQEPDPDPVPDTYVTYLPLVQRNTP